MRLRLSGYADRTTFRSTWEPVARPSEARSMRAPVGGEDGVLDGATASDDDSEVASDEEPYEDAVSDVEPVEHSRPHTHALPSSMGSVGGCQPS